ncbi:hypothetical protein RUND412_000450 [Rhizina undulata]
MDPAQAQAHLLQVLQSHELSLGEDDVAWAFSNPKTVGPVVEWVERYLGEETLLSLEEAEIFNHLQTTGALSRLQKQGLDVSLMPPRSEQSLQSEIDQLRASTQLLRQQTAVLKRQKAQAKMIASREQAQTERKKRLAEKRKKRWVAEKESLQAAVDDVLGILKEEIADLQAGMKDAGVDLEGAEKLLESDDRVLGRLERLAGGIVVPSEENDAEEREVIEKISTLVKKLSELSALSLRTRLDRLFLIHYPRLPGNDDSTTEEVDPTVEELKRDLESLYTEIPSVAEMAAQDEFLRPVLEEIEKNGARKESDRTWGMGGEYIKNVLLHLNKRATSTTELLRSGLARNLAIQAIISAIETESQPLPDPKPAGSSSVTPTQEATTSTLQPLTRPHRSGTIGKRPSSPNKHSLIRSIPAFTPPRRRGRSVDLSNMEYDLPELQLLSHLGVIVPSSAPSTPQAAGLFDTPAKGTLSPALSSSDPLAGLTDVFMTEQLSFQRGKLKIQEETVADAISSALETAIGDTWAVRDVLAQNIYSENPYPPPRLPAAQGGGAIVLVGDELREGIVEVQRKVDIVTGKMGKINAAVDELGRNGGDVEGVGGAKRGFVERWARR